MKRKNSHLRIFRHPSEGRKYAASNQEAKEPKSEKKERELLPSSSSPDAESVLVCKTDRCLQVGPWSTRAQSLQNKRKNKIRSIFSSLCFSLL